MAVAWAVAELKVAGGAVPARLRPAAREANLVFADVSWRWVTEGGARWRATNSTSKDFFSM